MALNCTLVDIDSMFYTSVQGTYFYQVIFGTRFKFSENQSTLRFHYPYWAPSILLRSRHYGLLIIQSTYIVPWFVQYFTKSSSCGKLDIAANKVFFSNIIYKCFPSSIVGGQYQSQGWCTLKVSQFQNVFLMPSFRP